MTRNRKIKMGMKYLLDNLRPLHEKQDALRLCKQNDYAIMKHVASEFGWRGGGVGECAKKKICHWKHKMI